MAVKTFTFATTSRDLATHLYKIGYSEHTISIVDGNKTWTFEVPISMKQQLHKQKKEFQAP